MEANVFLKGTIQEHLLIDTNQNPIIKLRKVFYLNLVSMRLGGLFFLIIFGILILLGLDWYAEA